jgi:hypothetical protein
MQPQFSAFSDYNFTAIACEKVLLDFQFDSTKTHTFSRGSLVSSCIVTLGHHGMISTVENSLELIKLERTVWN